MVKTVKALAHHRFQQNREIVAKYCKANQGDPDLITINQDPKWNKDLYFEYKYKMLYCQISKIGSSTWIDHLTK